MQSRLLSLAFLLLCALAPLRAASPDDQYLGIYYLIQEADAASAAGRNADALLRYEDALKSLQSLQKVSPNWEPNVVGYRLRYLANRIAVLKALGYPSLSIAAHYAKFVGVICAAVSSATARS